MSHTIGLYHPEADLHIDEILSSQFQVKRKPKRFGPRRLEGIHYTISRVREHIEISELPPFEDRPFRSLMCFATTKHLTLLREVVDTLKAKGAKDLMEWIVETGTQKSGTDGSSD